MEVKPGRKQTEVCVIPDEWKLSSIGDEFSVQLGKMLDSEKNVGVMKPFLGNRAVQWGRIDVTDLGNVRLTPSDLQRFRLRNGDLLVCEGGEIGRAAIWNQQLPECYYQKALHRLRPKRDYNVTLMLHVLQRYASIGFLSNFVTQTSIAHLPKDKFETIPVPLPPPPQQRAIAEALGDVDALLAALEKLIAKKRDLKQAAMQRLLTGETRLPGFNGKWDMKQFGELFQFVASANNPRADLSAIGDIGYIHYGDIHTTASVFLDCAAGMLPAISRTKVANIPLLEDGDLVMADASEDCEGIGKSVEIRNASGRKTVAGLHTLVLRGNRDLVADGFKAYLQFIPSVKMALVSRATGISVYGVSKNSVGGVEVMLPPPDEQSAIAGVLSDMDTEIAALDVRMAKTRALKQGMMQELLTGRTRLV